MSLIWTSFMGWLRSAVMATAAAWRAAAVIDRQLLPLRDEPTVLGSSFCTSVVMSASTASGSLARAPLTMLLRWSLITSVILRPLSPGNAYHLVSSASWLTAV